MTSTMPVLYSEPLPTETKAKLLEELRRVKRSRWGGERTLTYLLEGECGSWRLAPEGYYEQKSKGRKGRFIVKEIVDYREISCETLGSEQAAWDWVTAEHARRVDAKLSELAKQHTETTHRYCEELRMKLAAAEKVEQAWRELS